jgi:hypothetical protein
MPFGDGHSAPRIATRCLEFIDAQAAIRQTVSA